MTFSDPTYLPLSQLQTVCLKQNIPFASYRLPLQSKITTLVQHSSMPERIDSLQNLNTKSGFVVAPFFETEKHGVYFLQPDNIFDTNTIEQDFLQNLALNSQFLEIKQPSEFEISSTLSEDFIQQVNLAKEEMTDGKFNKVVLSRVRLEKLSDSFDASAFYLKLCAIYPHAFVYMIQLPEVGVWMGATPEPFLVIENEKVKTVSLAGTQLATDADIESYNWSPKEIEEQGIVTNFVEQSLKSLQIKNYIKKGPENYQAANLIHLKTSFEFELSELNNHLDDFINTMHPTPSVGGLPKTEARNFILANEKYDRAYYTGYLGPINIENKSNLFVNLRCLQLFEKHFALYSGAGITTSSNAEKEWEETNNKMKTLMNVMNS
ncbi:MAG: isochorismate synthase [Paludibacter sp.]